MALITLRQLLDHAAENEYGVPAFNVNNLEQVRAIMEGADEVSSPVILQASAGARKYAGANFLRHLIQGALEEFPQIPIVMHQDHGVSPAVCQRSIQLGFTSVMMDGSLGEDGKTPMDFEYNVRVTRQAVEMAHACGVSVEGELGCLGSLETGMAGEEDGIGAEGKLTMEQLLTDPEEAGDFVAATGVDALAIAVGTSHGAYKFSRPPTGDILAIDRIKAIHARIPSTHLVMHGSSSVPQDWLEVINEFGGEIPETYGVPVEEIQEGIRHGVRKVNIDTDFAACVDGRGAPFPGAEPVRVRPAQVPDADDARHARHRQGAAGVVRLRRHDRPHRQDLQSRGNVGPLRQRLTPHVQPLGRRRTARPGAAARLFRGGAGQRPAAGLPRSLRSAFRARRRPGSPQLRRLRRGRRTACGAIFRGLSAGGRRRARSSCCMVISTMPAYTAIRSAGASTKAMPPSSSTCPDMDCLAGEAGGVDNFARYCDALCRALALAGEQRLARPWHAVGQSTGGAILMDSILHHGLMETHALDGVALLAPLVRILRHYRSRLMYLLSGGIVDGTPRLYAESSHDREFLEFLRHEDDLQSSRIPRSWIGAMFDYGGRFAAAAPHQAPLTVIQGTGDDTVDWKFNLPAIRGKFPAAKEVLVPGARHHLVNESREYRDPVFQALTGAFSGSM